MEQLEEYIFLRWQVLCLNYLFANIDMGVTLGHQTFCKTLMSKLLLKFFFMIWHF